MPTSPSAAGIDLIEAIFSQPVLFHHLRRPLYWGSLGRVEAALGLQDGERLLDVGCGTGQCARLARGPYVGIDTAIPYLRFARQRQRDGERGFVAMSAFDCAFPERAFDRALLINMVHHLDDVAATRLLAQLRRVVRRRVVLMEAAPEIANPIERFLLRHDRGDHVRGGPALRALVEPHFEIEAEERFHNFLHISPQVLLSLRPRD